MILYCLFFLWICFIGAIYDISERRMKIPILMVILFSLISFSGMRYNTGTDFNEYSYIFDANKNTDIGYDLLSLTMKTIANEFQLLVLLIAAIINSAIVIAFRSVGSKLFLPLLIYVGFWYYFGSWNLMRQYLAMAIILLLFADIEGRAYSAKNLILSVIAVSFHISAVLPAMFYFLSRFHPKIISIFNIALLTVAVGYESIIPLLPVADELRFFHYLDTEGSTNITPTILALLAIVPILIINRLNRLDRNEKILIYLRLYVSGMFFMSLAIHNIFFSRMAFYFLIMLPFLLNLTLPKISNNSLKTVFITYYILLATVIFASSMTQNRDGVVPYYSILY